jgi:type IX secretion system PorP/SprF family membrane protein
MKRVSLTCILICSIFLSYAQDPVFYNSNQSLIQLNPSFAGSNGGIRNQFSYRSQGSNINPDFSTYLNSTDCYLKKIKAGLAISYLNDNWLNSTIETNIFSVSYAQYFSVMEGKLKIIPSVQFAYAKRTADFSALNLDDAKTNPWGITEAFPSRQYADISSGLVINYKNKAYIGVALFHLNEPDAGITSTYKLLISTNVHASYNFELSEKNQLQATYVFKNQNFWQTHRLGLNLISFKHLITGVAITNFDTPIISLGYRNNFFNVLVGYDVNMSRLAGSTYKSWELHASFNLRNKEQRKALTSFETW